MLALRYGSIPIVRETGGLRDTVVDVEKAKKNENEGNGFTFAAYSADAMRDACFRAKDLYGGNRNEWNKLVRRAMKCDHSWTTGAKEYVTMYDEAIKLW
jgi:starch synthase